jgi:fatty acid desaturase
MFEERKEKIDTDEKELEERVRNLPNEEKKKYFKAQALRLKDPDDYAVFNYMFLGGFHHFYLGNYLIFIIEIVLFMLAIVLFFQGFAWSLLILVALSIYELPQLFLSQIIVREKNLEISQSIIREIETDKE